LPANVYSTVGQPFVSLPPQRDVQDFDYMVHAVGFGIRYRRLLTGSCDLGIHQSAKVFSGCKEYQHNWLSAESPKT